MGPSTDAPARQWIVTRSVLTHSDHGRCNTKKDQAERGKGEEFQQCSVTLILLLSLCLSICVTMYVCHAWTVHICVRASMYVNVCMCARWYVIPHISVGVCVRTCVSARKRKAV